MHNIDKPLIPVNLLY